MAENQNNPETVLHAVKIPVELDTTAADLQLDAFEERLDRILDKLRTVKVGEEDHRQPHSLIELLSEKPGEVRDEQTGIAITPVDLPQGTQDRITVAYNIDRIRALLETIDGRLAEQEAQP